MPKIPNILVLTYMELCPEDFEPSYVTDDRMMIQELVAPDIRYYRFMYSTVGDQWNWTDRLLLEDEDLLRILQDSHMRMFVLYYEGAPAGYIELVRRDEYNTEVKYFGIREPFLGMGLGKHLLSYGLEVAFADGAHRVVLDTCNLDGPYALKNYQKRGFKITKIVEQPMPDKEYIKLTARQRGMY